MKVTIVSGDGGSVHFFRVKADDLEKILDTVLKSISDTSWLNELDEKFLEDCYKLRAEATIKDIEKKFKACDGSNVSSEAGEYIVSELARETLKNELGYMPAPLSELLGKKNLGTLDLIFIMKIKRLKLFFLEKRNIKIIKALIRMR